MGGHVARREPCIQSIKGKKKSHLGWGGGGVGSPIFLNFQCRERERARREKKSKLLSLIHGVPSVGIRQAKNESSSTR